MSDAELGKVERQVLRALRDKPAATVEQIAALLDDTGASSVVEANAALARNHLVEPVPDGNGTLRLTSQGAKLASELADVKAERGSGGGDSAFN